MEELKIQRRQLSHDESEQIVLKLRLSFDETCSKDAKGD